MFFPFLKVKLKTILHLSVLLPTYLTSVQGPQREAQCQMLQDKSCLWVLGPGPGSSTGTTDALNPRALSLAPPHASSYFRSKRKLIGFVYN